MTDGPLVIDASVLAKIYLKDEEFAPVARAIVDRYVDGSLELVAPQFILYEIPSAIQAAVRQRRLDPGTARQAVQDFFDLRIRTLGDVGTLPTMIQLAYARASQLVTAAETLGYQLVTADRKLYNAIKDRVGYALWIADYEVETDALP